MGKADKKAMYRLCSELLAEGMAVRLVASGYSMYPTIRPGDIIEVSPLKKNVLMHGGEIIAVRRDDDFVVHRFMGFLGSRDDRSVLLRGDSALRYDEPVPVDSVVGRVRSVKREGKVIIPRWPQQTVRYRRNNIMAAVARVVDMVILR